MILTFAKQQSIKEISLNNKKKFEQISKEVGNLEICNLLGLQTFQSISDDDTDLLDGCTFEYCGLTYKSQGLNYVWAYLNYASYIAESQVADTFTGVVQKNREDSVLISDGKIKMLQQRNREIALNEFEIIKMYMYANPTKYPLFCANKKTMYAPKITGISKMAESRNKNHIYRIK